MARRRRAEAHAAGRVVRSAVSEWLRPNSPANHPEAKKASFRCLGTNIGPMHDGIRNISNVLRTPLRVFVRNRAMAAPLNDVHRRTQWARIRNRQHFCFLAAEDHGTRCRDDRHAEPCKASNMTPLPIHRPGGLVLAQLHESGIKFSSHSDGARFHHDWAMAMTLGA